MSELNDGIPQKSKEISPWIEADLWEGAPPGPGNLRSGRHGMENHHLDASGGPPEIMARIIIPGRHRETLLLALLFYLGTNFQLSARKFLRQDRGLTRLIRESYPWDPRTISATIMALIVDGQLSPDGDGFKLSDRSWSEWASSPVLLRTPCHVFQRGDLTPRKVVIIGRIGACSCREIPYSPTTMNLADDLGIARCNVSGDLKYAMEIGLISCEKFTFNGSTKPRSRWALRQINGTHKLETLEPTNSKHLPLPKPQTQNGEPANSKHQEKACKIETIQTANSKQLKPQNRNNSNRKLETPSEGTEVPIPPREDGGGQISDQEDPKTQKIQTIAALLAPTQIRAESTGRELVLERLAAKAIDQGWSPDDIPPAISRSERRGKNPGAYLADILTRPPVVIGACQPDLDWELKSARYETDRLAREKVEADAQGITVQELHHQGHATLAREYLESNVTPEDAIALFARSGVTLTTEQLWSMAGMEPPKPKPKKRRRKKP